MEGHLHVVSGDAGLGCEVSPQHPFAPFPLETELLAGHKAARMEVTFSVSLAAGCGRGQLLAEPWVGVVCSANAPTGSGWASLIFYFLLAGCEHGQSFWTRAGHQDLRRSLDINPVCAIPSWAVNAQAVK